MGMGGNLILLLSGEGALHHVKIIESGQQRLRAGEAGLSTDPLAKGPGLRSVPLPSEAAVGVLGHPSRCPQGLETGPSAPERVHESAGSTEVLLGVEEAV